MSPARNLETAAVLDEAPAPLSLCPYHYTLAGKVCRRVTKADCPDLPALLREMVRFCRRHEGVGLAAPQVGIFIQLAIVVYSAHNSRPIALINPEIVRLAGRDLLDGEGCLSLPGPFADYPTARIWRSEIATVKSGTLEDPDREVTTIWKGFEARIAQHEIDHLRGIFFIDHCQELARKRVLAQFGQYLRSRATDRS